MNKLLLPEKQLWTPKCHYSTGDWDFMNPWWELQTSDYQSSPSSLEMSLAGIPWVENNVICKASGMTVIDQGRLESYLKSGDIGDAYPQFLFRAQTAVGSSSRRDSYWISFRVNQTIWYYRDAGAVDSIVGYFTNSIGSVIWYRFRATWWNGKDLQNNDATVLRLEMHDGDSWVQESSDLYDTNERNKGSAINRVGVGCELHLGHYVRFDDTKLWF